MNASKPVNSAGAGRVGAVVEPELFGPYRLDELIGRGGMGEVYRAFDTRRDRVVALKRLPVALGADIEFRTRFRREAALAARLQAPHIVPIHDYGDIDGRLFLDMPFVTGTDLGRLLADHGPLDPSRAVGIIAQVASALDAAHAQGLAHRDVKPSNVLLTSDEFAYLADFGVARTLAGGTTLTVTGATVGTLAYMAPECFLGQSGDHLADIYALACVLFELLTGQPPFSGDGLPALMYAHVHLPPPQVSRQQSGVPAGLDEVIARGMAKDPSRRYATAGQLASAATAAVHTPTNIPYAATTIVPPHRPPAGTIPRPHSPHATPDGRTPATDRRQRRHWLLLTTAIALVIAMAVTAFVFHNQSSTRLVLSTSQVNVGDTYSATASGFSPREDVRFSWTGLTSGVMGVFPANLDGSTTHGGILEREPLGNYTITVTGLTSGRTASVDLQVIAGTGTGTGPTAARLMLSKSPVALGDTYFATAWGFSPREDVRFSWTGPSVGVMGVSSADAGGSKSHGPIFERHPPNEGVIGVFPTDSGGSTAVEITENDSPGDYTITVTGSTSGRTVSARLQVVQPGS